MLVGDAGEDPEQGEERRASSWHRSWRDKKKEIILGKQLRHFPNRVK